jgi:hypothetical protein
VDRVDVLERVGDLLSARGLVVLVLEQSRVLLYLLGRQNRVERRAVAEPLSDSSGSKHPPPETVSASSWGTTRKLYLQRPRLRKPRDRDTVVDGRVNVVDFVRVENIGAHTARRTSVVRRGWERSDDRAAREANLSALVVELRAEARPATGAGELFRDALPVDVFPLLERRSEACDSNSVEGVERFGSQLVLEESDEQPPDLTTEPRLADAASPAQKNSAPAPHLTVLVEERVVRLPLRPVEREITLRWHRQLPQRSWPLRLLSAERRS